MSGSLSVDTNRTNTPAVPKYASACPTCMLCCTQCAGLCLITCAAFHLCVCVPQVTGRELGSRKKKSDSDAPAAAAPATSSSPQSSRGQKFRARKSREAAAKAATLAKPAEQNGAAERQAAPAAAPTATSQQEPLKVPDAPPSKN